MFLKYLLKSLVMNVTQLNFLNRQNVHIWNFIKVNRKRSLLFCSHHSHKKWKDRLEGSLDWVLFAAELEFPKILLPMLLQHTSSVNIECAGKSEWSKQLYFLYMTSFLEHWYNLILLFWYWSVFNWWCLV